MAAIVRIKRRREEDPQDLLLLSCKKHKQSGDIEHGNVVDEKAVFKFAGTVSSKDAAVSKPVREAIRKEKLEKEFKQHQIHLYGGVRQQARLEHKQCSEKSRYRVVSSHRALNLDKLDDIDENEDNHSDTKQTGNPSKQIIHSDDKTSSVCKLSGKPVYPQKQTDSVSQCESPAADSVVIKSQEIETNVTNKGSVNTKGNVCKKETKDSIKKCDKVSNGNETDKEAEGSVKECDNTGGSYVNNTAKSSLTTTIAASTTTCSGEVGQGERMYCLLDVETDLPSYQSVLNQLTTDQITCNSEPMTRELAPERGSDDDYVYDLYYINNRDFDFRSLESGLVLETMSEDRLYAGGLSDEEEFIYEDDDDENNENNWRNDYPDEDPRFVDNREDEEDEFYGEGLQEIHAFESGQDNQLAEWMSWRCNIEDDATELSSDDDVENYEQGPTNSKDYYKYVREMVDGNGSESDDGTELPTL